MANMDKVIQIRISKEELAEIQLIVDEVQNDQCTIAEVTVSSMMRYAIKKLIQEYKERKS